jgi:hypothetical protein
VLAVSTIRAPLVGVTIPYCRSSDGRVERQQPA